jgi:hypothetical protein
MAKDVDLTPPGVWDALPVFAREIEHHTRRALRGTPALARWRAVPDLVDQILRYPKRIYGPDAHALRGIITAAVTRGAGDADPDRAH